MNTQKAADELGPTIRGIRDLGMFTSAKVSEDLVPVVSKRQLQRLLGNVQALMGQGFRKLALHGNGFRPFPPNSLRFAGGLLDKDLKIGLLHWKEGHGLVIRLDSLAALARQSSPPSDFAQLISALQSAGWQARDIAFSEKPCPPFMESEPEVTEQTAIMPAVAVDDIAAAKDWISKAVRFSQSGSSDESAQCFEHALDFNPGDDDAWAGLAAILLTTKQYDKALRCCNCALLLKPHHAGALFNKGIVLINGFRNHREALTCFEEAQRHGMTQAGQAITACRRALGLG
ncbi:MAG: tetratricopeptide repeat protein [Acidobacteria bacterium]|nr:tetratricopeptide repeat protein [Acidobacteriota bacterium]